MAYAVPNLPRIRIKKNNARNANTSSGRLVRGDFKDFKDGSQSPDGRIELPKDARRISSLQEPDARRFDLLFGQWVGRSQISRLFRSHSPVRD